MSLRILIFAFQIEVLVLEYIAKKLSKFALFYIDNKLFQDYLLNSPPFF